jgi:hypothetical protein|tara:strand:- start:1489 stop:1815 length:327 start_codon:yes stop_codon:yes gene_type:complete
MGRYITSTLSYATTTVTTAISYQAKTNDRVMCTAGSITITLPAAASALVGDTVQILDVTGVAGTNNITVGRNGADIQNVAEDLVININNTAPILVYSGATYGWVISGS